VGVGARGSGGGHLCRRGVTGCAFQFSPCHSGAHWTRQSWMGTWWEEEAGRQDEHVHTRVATIASGARSWEDSGRATIGHSIHTRRKGGGRALVVRSLAAAVAWVTGVIVVRFGVVDLW
jgi:hypothetical protein